jgi:hypothetical protein
MSQPRHSAAPVWGLPPVEGAVPGWRRGGAWAVRGPGNSGKHSRDTSGGLTCCARRSDLQPRGHTAAATRPVPRSDVFIGPQHRQIDPRKPSGALPKEPPARDLHVTGRSVQWADRRTIAARLRTSGARPVLARMTERHAEGRPAHHRGTPEDQRRKTRPGAHDRTPSRGQTGAPAGHARGPATQGASLRPPRLLPNRLPHLLRPCPARPDAHPRPDRLGPPG